MGHGHVRSWGYKELARLQSASTDEGVFFLIVTSVQSAGKSFELCVSRQWGGVLVRSYLRVLRRGGERYD